MAILEEQYKKIQQIISEEDDTFLINCISNLKIGCDNNGWNNILIIVGDKYIRKTMVDYLTSVLRTQKRSCAEEFGLVLHDIQLIHITEKFEFENVHDADMLRSLDRYKGLGILIEMDSKPKIPDIFHGHVRCINVEFKPNQIIQNAEELSIFEEWSDKLRKNKTMKVKFLIIVGSGNNGKTSLIRTVSNKLNTERQNINKISCFKSETKLIWFTEHFKEWNSDIVGELMVLAEYNIGMIMELQTEPHIPAYLQEFTHVIHANHDFNSST
jgi:hypothetical protein